MGVLQRKEYPRPQFRRDGWQNLNGEWEFAFDDEDSGIERGLYMGAVALDRVITVPFSYQYPASGIGDTAQHNVVWYRRAVVIEREFMQKRALLCFNGADYITDVWVNGKHVVTHTGGFAPFSADITRYLKDGENVLVVRCEDTLEESVPRGKQSWTGKPFSCFYVPNTGIWQSVWLEFFGEDCICNHTLLPDFDKSAFYGDIRTLYGKADEVEIVARYERREITRTRVRLAGNYARYRVELNRRFIENYEWSPDCPRLVEVDFILFRRGKREDVCHTRFAMRKIEIDEKGQICLNNRPFYQRLVLDQGYWEESGITPPSAEALKQDILQAKAMGFNGARKHQKLEDPYFYYYAEELGFVTWCEMPSAYRFHAGEVAAVTKEWQEILSVAKNQTSNICYVPLNESWGVNEVYSDRCQQNFARSLYYLTKSVDGEKLVSTNDGFENVTPTDFVSVHDYGIDKAESFPKKYKAESYDGLCPQGWKLFAQGNNYSGQPVLFTEFGGVAMQNEEKNGAWGYNGGAKDCEEFYARLEELLKGIGQTDFQGYCYTQLTDVQQEVNGLLRTDRTPKFDLARLKNIFSIR